MPAAGDAKWSHGEQQGAAQATAQTLDELAEANRAYEAQLGFIYIVCASGRNADEMLADLRARLANSREVELAHRRRRAGEDHAPASHQTRPGARMITTHVLDTSIGRPGRNIAVELERVEQGVWHLVGGGVTDNDGRLRTLTPEGPVAPGTYRIRFQTGAYFSAEGLTGFFPVVEIQFTEHLESIGTQPEVGIVGGWELVGAGQPHSHGVRPTASRLRSVRCSDNVLPNSASPPGQVAGIDRAFACNVSPRHAPHHVFERTPGDATRPLPAGYRPRRPDATDLYRIVATHLETMLADARDRSPHGFGLPRHVEQTFRRWQARAGFTRGRCQACTTRSSSRKVGARRLAGSGREVSERPLPNRACTFRYAPGSPGWIAKSGRRAEPSR